MEMELKQEEKIGPKKKDNVDITNNGNGNTNDGGNGNGSVNGNGNKRKRKRRRRKKPTQQMQGWNRQNARDDAGLMGVSSGVGATPSVSVPTMAQKQLGLAQLQTLIQNGALNMAQLQGLINSGVVDNQLVMQALSGATKNVRPFAR